jgi:RNA polymerase sigma-70 factor, ECF subfamily
MTHPTDEQLRDMCRQGDPKAFDALVATFGPRLHAFITGFTGDPAGADDILQETLITASRTIGNNGSGPLASFLFRIARNSCLDNRRSLTRRADRERRFEESRTNTIPPAEETVLRAAEAATVRSALQQLPERQRSALSLFAVGGLSIREIASAMHCSQGAVTSHLHRARQAMKKILESSVVEI